MWLWFAFKKGTLIYLQQPHQSLLQRELCCDSLSKKELWYICNNQPLYKSCRNAVVIRFQKRNFDIFATTEQHQILQLYGCDSLSKKELWYICNNTYIFSKNYSPGCDSLSKKELWYICNNKEARQQLAQAVVIRFQKRNFDIFATTMLFLHFCLSSCDSLSKKELWYICNNEQQDRQDEDRVVIRFQKRNFDIFATTKAVKVYFNFPLWFAFKKGTLIYLQQQNTTQCVEKRSCDSLSKKELWYICNNFHRFFSKTSRVVIRFQKRNFDIFATTDGSPVIFKKELWFAFKKGTLIYLQQQTLQIQSKNSSCDSLSKKELWYICNNLMNMPNIATTLWFAFKKGTLIYLQQRDKRKAFSCCVVIRFQKRNFDIFATTLIFAT